MQEKQFTHSIVTNSVTYTAYDVKEDKKQVTFTTIVGHDNEEKTYTLPHAEIVEVKLIPRR